MGAEAITRIKEQTADCQQAFAELQQQARLEYGSDPYNGSLSTISGYQLSTDYSAPLPLSCLPWVERQIWDRHRQGLVPEIEKWTSCLALPLADDQQFSWTEASADLEINADYRQYPDYPLRQALRQLLGPEELVGKISWQLSSEAGELQIVDSDQPALVAEPGFAVLSGSQKLLGPLFATRQEAIDRARKMAADRQQTLEVVEIRPAAYSCQREELRDRYRVTYSQPEPTPRTTVSGWAFIGLAAS